MFGLTRAIRAVVLLSPLLFVGGCTSERSGGGPQGAVARGDTEQDSHQRMLELLREIRDRTSFENEYLGDGPARRLQQQLAQLPSDANPVDRFQHHWQLAKMQLQIGETEQAIEQFRACAALAPTVTKLVGEDKFIQDDLDFQLSVAYLRQAENQNCVHCRNEACCIFPIGPDGVHADKGPAENAIRHLTAFLERNPKDPSARWLLNVAHMTVGTYPERVPAPWLVAPELFAGDKDFPRFRNIAPELELDLVSLCGGMVVDDLNGDGWLDVVVSDWSTSGQIRCYLSDGHGRFIDTTAEAGLLGILGGLNLVQADYDNDGDIDILVLRGAWLHEAGRHPNSLLQNDGHGRFRDVTFDVGLGDTHYPTQSAAWADYDNDGDLDLYIANEIGPSELFNNDGRGRFSNVAFQAGVANGGSPKGVIWGDYDNDRYPDLFVSNFVGPNRLFHNNGDGTFNDLAAAAKVEGPVRSFPTWFWDFNNDGNLDLFVAAYWSHVDYFAADFLQAGHEVETDRLYQGDGKGGFLDVTAQMKLDHVTLPMGSNFGDVDNDGYPDIYLGTGYPDYEGIMPNRMFHNRGGREFADVTTASGLGHLQKGHGVAFADFDHDGDLDIFIEMGGAFPGDAFANAVFENPGFGGNWMKLKLIGKQTNRNAIGARIRVEIEDGGQRRSIYKWVNSGGTFGGSPLQQHVGLGSAVDVKVLEIYWPTSDTTQIFEDVAANQLLQVTEGEEHYRRLNLTGIHDTSESTPKQ